METRNNPGDSHCSTQWLLEPIKSRKFHLPWHGPYEGLETMSEVKYQICKRGTPGKWQNFHFNRLKPYLGESLPTRFERLGTKTLPNVEEIEDESDRPNKRSKIMFFAQLRQKFKPREIGRTCCSATFPA